MKNNNTKTYIIIGVIVIVLVIIGVWGMGQSGGNSMQTVITASSSQPLGSGVSGTSGTGVSAPKAAAKSPAVPTQTPTSASTYASYLTRYDAAQSSCKESAAKQNVAAYPSLGQSSFQTYFNTVSGVCYEKLTGVILHPYSSTTTGATYFRNVTTDSLMMECLDANGMTLPASDWQCTDKGTGQAISLAQFNAMLYDYTTK